MREFNVTNGMALSIWKNKYARKKPDGTHQTYAERVREVVAGNFMLDPRTKRDFHHTLHREACEKDWQRTEELAVAGVFPTSGRHLQHGDDHQADRLLEMHANCATAMFSFMLFRLLLRGSGVGRDYSAACCRVDWSKMPDVRLVLDASHPDFDYTKFQGFLEPLRDARHKYDSDSEQVRWFKVSDSREGWAKVIEILETAAWSEKHTDKLFIFDFTDVRAKGKPIRGLQNRPASGPLPLMDALARVASIKRAGMKPWKQAMFIDHYLGQVVHLGGARRSARMAVKSWRDRDVLEFIDIKRGGFLDSANNSLLVDEDFWTDAKRPQHTHARRVFEAAVNAAYWDRTGDPGFINVDKLNNNLDGIELITGSNYLSKEVYDDLHNRTQDMIDNVLSHVKQLKHPFLVNPCSEIVLSVWGGLCIIGDVCLAQVKTLDEAQDAVHLMSQFLIRCNLMRSDYAAEVKRTNRIGVAITGIHEFAWNMFGLTFADMVDYFPLDDKPLNDTKVAHKAFNFWHHIGSLREIAVREAAVFSKLVGLPTPHTVTTIKPSGTVSKVMSCTEGAHLPALSHYLRWVQYREDDPALADLMERGYPTEDVGHRYHQQVVVGFPTKQPIVDLMGAKVTTADEVSVEDNFKWLMLLERFWLGAPGHNNQVSYTLKYDTTKVSYQQFMDLILEWQPQVRCCAVMPQSDWRETKRLYGYVPEQPISKEVYDTMVAVIDRPVTREDYDEDTLACESGACPIEPDLA
jgi:adenosylcobalamin-dependent ribonucleoside-triphosphate reductase